MGRFPPHRAPPKVGVPTPNHSLSILEFRPPAKYHLAVDEKALYYNPTTSKFRRSSPIATSKMPPEQPAAAATPPNFWGDTPEEEYYTSQGVRNTKSYFETPHGKLFTQSFLPLDPTLPVKATVFMSHGYGSDTGWMFQKICISYANWGYAVFAADLLGHGRSDGIRCYLGDLNKVASASLSFFKSVRVSDEYKDLPAFLFGESMGGLATLLMYFQSEKEDLWTRLIFSAPLFVIPEPMKPSKVI